MSKQTLPFEIRRLRRSGARLAAVQAVFQLEATGQSAKSVIRDFMEDRMGLGSDAEPIEDADPDIFASVVNGVVDNQAAIDAAIVKRLASGWKITRLDATSRAILRCGVSELMMRIELKPGVIIEEYVGLAHAFFEGSEPGFVNGVLDTIARDVRDPETGLPTGAA